MPAWAADGRPWDAYLLHRLTPELERIETVQAPNTRWLAIDERLIAPDFADGLIRPQNSRLMLSLGSGQSRLTVSSDPARLSSEGTSFQQSVLMPGLSSQVSEATTLTVSAVLASQQFSSGDLNLIESDSPTLPEYTALGNPYNRPEVTQGAGLRLAMLTELASQWSFDAAFQSRIDMAELATLRGLHGSFAELDIPSRIQTGLQLHATSNSSFRVGIEHIFYSEVGAFPSRALPARFTALLGDSSSPRFAWDDLVVYSLGWQWSNGHDLSLFVDYRTRSQPEPTAPVLADALRSELADNALLAGLNKRLSRLVTLRLSASYAPPEFAFGGNVLGVVSDRLDQDYEVQAMLQFDL